MIFTQFSQNRLLTMKYCFVKDCNITSSCENGILHSIKEKWILIVTWKTILHLNIFRNHPEYCNIKIDLSEWSTWPVQVVKVVKDKRTSSLYILSPRWLVIFNFLHLLFMSACYIYNYVHEVSMSVCYIYNYVHEVSMSAC